MNKCNCKFTGLTASSSCGWSTLRGGGFDGAPWDSMAAARGGGLPHWLPGDPRDRPPPTQPHPSYAWKHTGITSKFYRTFCSVERSVGSQQYIRPLSINSFHYDQRLRIQPLPVFPRGEVELTFSLIRSVWPRTVA